MTTTQTFPHADTKDSPDLLELVTSALESKGRLPCRRPTFGLPHNLDRYDVANLYLERHAGGWVANIAFEGVFPGLPNTVGTPDAAPFPSRQQAFLAGAALLCQILTGSAKLPVFVVGDKLIIAG